MKARSESDTKLLGSALSYTSSLGDGALVLDSRSGTSRSFTSGACSAAQTCSREVDAGENHAVQVHPIEIDSVVWMLIPPAIPRSVLYSHQKLLDHRSFPIGKVAKWGCRSDIQGMLGPSTLRDCEALRRRSKQRQDSAIPVEQRTFIAPGRDGDLRFVR